MTVSRVSECVRWEQRYQQPDTAPAPHPVTQEFS